MTMEKIGIDVVQNYGQRSPMIQVYLRVNHITAIGLAHSRDGYGWEVWEVSEKSLGFPQRWYQRKADAKAYALELCSKTGLPLEEF